MMIPVGYRSSSCTTLALHLPARCRLALTDCRALQLCGLRADMQPVTDNDMCSVLLPFTFCSREERPRLVQYTENILLAMNLGAQFVALSSTLGRVVLPDAACAPQCILCWLSTRPPEPSARWSARPCWSLASSTRTFRGGCPSSSAPRETDAVSAQKLGHLPAF